MGKLQNKIAIVTGGSSGIGRAIANRFAAEGAFVYVVGRREADPADTVAKSDRVLRQSKLTSRIWKNSTQSTLELPPDGRTLDIVVSNAGMREIRPLADADAALWTHRALPSSRYRKLCLS